MHANYSPASKVCVFSENRDKQLINFVAKWIPNKVSFHKLLQGRAFPAFALITLKNKPFNRIASYLSFIFAGNRWEAATLSLFAFLGLNPKVGGRGERFFLGPKAAEHRPRREAFKMVRSAEGIRGKRLGLN